MTDVDWDEGQAMMLEQAIEYACELPRGHNRREADFAGGLNDLDCNQLKKKPI